MQRGAEPSWQVREDADHAVLIALYLRTALGVRRPDELPPLRGVAAQADASDELAEQWLRYWDMTVEPVAHPADGPLELVPGFAHFVALPRSAAALRTAIEPLAGPAMAYARRAHERQALESRGRAGDASWAGGVRNEERRIGRPAHPFVLKVQVLPFTQRGIWWIGELTIAVTDGLRDDVAAFGKAIRPILADVV